MSSTLKGTTETADSAFKGTAPGGTRTGTDTGMGAGLGAGIGVKSSGFGGGHAAASSGSFIDIIKQDHSTVENLFEQLLGERSGSWSKDEKERIFNLLREELSKHAAAEERIVYPLFNNPKMGAEGKELYKHALDEHLDQKRTLDHLMKLDVTTTEFTTELTKLKQEVMHHVKDNEEKIVLPKMDSVFTMEEKLAIGKKFNEAKASAPTHPHPMAPNKGPLAAAAQVMSKPLDMAVDAITGKNKKPKEGMLGNQPSSGRPII